MTGAADLVWCRISGVAARAEHAGRLFTITRQVLIWNYFNAPTQIIFELHISPFFGRPRYVSAGPDLKDQMAQAARWAAQLPGVA